MLRTLLEPLILQAKSNGAQCLEFRYSSEQRICMGLTDSREMAKSLNLSEKCFFFDNS